MAKSREVRMTPELKHQVRELSFDQRTSMSALAREQVETYAKGKVGKPAGAPVVLDLIKFECDDDVWQKALDRAQTEGTTLSEVVRDGLERKVAAFRL